MKNSVVIVVPMYREATDSEIISLKSLFKHLGNYDICFVGPKQFNVPVSGRHQWIKVHPKWMQTHLNYNKWMYSLDFYERFAEYEWILIFQLDAVILKPELDQWVTRSDFDFIGAPGIQYDENNKPVSIKDGFNGGVSLRRVKSFINVLKSNVAYEVKPEKFNRFRWYRKSQFKYKDKLVAWVFTKFKRLNQYYYHSVFELMEDGFWSYIVPKYHKKFRCAAKEDAMRFCFDRSPTFLYEKTGEMPFAAHAWEKWEPEFWEKNKELFDH